MFCVLLLLVKSSSGSVVTVRRNPAIEVSGDEADDEFAHPPGIRSSRDVSPSQYLCCTRPHIADPSAKNSVTDLFAVTPMKVTRAEFDSSRLSPRLLQQFVHASIMLFLTHQGMIDCSLAMREPFASTTPTRLWVPTFLVCHLVLFSCARTRIVCAYSQYCSHS